MHTVPRPRKLLALFCCIYCIILCVQIYTDIMNLLLVIPMSILEAENYECLILYEFAALVMMFCDTALYCEFNHKGLK